MRLGKDLAIGVIEHSTGNRRPEEEPTERPAEEQVGAVLAPPSLPEPDTLIGTR